MEETDNDNILQRSLQEIATLLFLIYESYLQDAHGINEILIRLNQFLYDIGLNEQISILQVELMRRNSMKSETLTMGYDMFYAWLRELAAIIFRYADGGDKKAFHSLLTIYILPLASKGSNDDKVILFKFDEKILINLLDYSDFFHLWYSSLCTNDNDINIRLFPIIDYWTTVMKSSVNGTKISNIIDSLKKCNIIPVLIDSNHLINLINTVQDRDETMVTFINFLRIVVLIANHIDNDKSININDNIIYLIHIVSQNLMMNTFDKFWLSNSNNKIEEMELVDDELIYLNIDSILLIFRQTGLSQIKIHSNDNNLTICWLKEKIEEFSMNKSLNGWNLKNLQYLICYIMEIITSELLINYNKNNNILIDDYIHLYIAKILPTVLFATPISSSTIISKLFSLNIIQKLPSIIHSIENLYFKCLDIQSNNNSSVLVKKENCSLFISSFISLCQKTSVIPQIATFALTTKTCEHVLGISIDKDNIDLILISDGDLIEILFILSQLCFGDTLKSFIINNNNTNEEDIIIEIDKLDISKYNDSFENFNKLLKCLIDFDYLNLITSKKSIELEENKQENVKESNNEDINEGYKKQDITNDNSLLQQVSDIVTKSKKPELSIINPSLLVNESNITLKQSSNSRTGSSFRDILILLLHFPLNSFKLNPWELVQLFRQILPENSTYDGDCTNYLSDIFKIFCDKFYILPKELASFFASIYEIEDNSTSNETPKIKKSIREILSSLFVDYLLSDRTLRLLLANVELLRWEFCIFCCQYRSKDPFTSNVNCPIPRIETVEMNSEDTMMSQASAIAWGIKVGKISKENAINILDNIFEFNSSSNNYLSFSNFIFFIVHCFTFKLFSNSLDYVPTFDNFIDNVRKMLQILSDNLSFIQQSVKLRLLKLFLVNNNQVSIDLNEKTSLLQCSMQAFNKHGQKKNLNISSSQSEFNLLPPRPPQIFWDVCRFIEFCKFSGVSEFNLNDEFLSISILWRSFGVYLKSINSSNNSNWNPIVVPPLPIKIETESLFSLLKNIPFCYNNKETAGKLNHFAQYILINLISPNVISIDQSDDSTLSKSVVENQKNLEDIIRYGGENSMISIEIGFSFLKYIFHSLSKKISIGSSFPSSKKLRNEITLTSACQYFSCNGLIRPAAVAVLAKQSLHPRLRPLANDNTTPRVSVIEATLSFPEFEELFIRCAFSIWETSGAYKKQNLNPNIIIQTLSPSSPTMYSSPTVINDIVNIYCREVSEVTNIKLNPKSWGIDFIRPFYAILRYLESNLANKVGFFAQNQLNENSPNINSPSINNSKNTINFIVSKPPQSLDVLKITADASVITRSSELLVDILKDRLNHSVADPLLTRNSPKKIQKSSSSPKQSKIPVAKSTPYNSILSRTSSKEDLDNSKIIFKKEIATTSSLLDGTKEALWPVYATYCSCGDSTIAGKLSGPNLFTLISKLGMLTHQTVMSDLGILLHQISTHSQSNSILSIAGISHDDTYVSPTLSFEEFLVFLCSFSQLRYEDNISTSMLRNVNIIDNNNINKDRRSQSWYLECQIFMESSASFRRLLEECVIPVLKKYPLLAFPEDARQRDKYSSVFSLEALLAVEGAEGPMLTAFNNARNDTHIFPPRSPNNVNKAESNEIKPILAALRRINLVPQIIAELQVLQLVKDVMPEVGVHNQVNSLNDMLFPQWEWIISVVACQAVEIAVSESSTPTSPEKIPSLVADVITSIASAMKASL